MILYPAFRKPAHAISLQLPAHQSAGAAIVARDERGQVDVEQPAVAHTYAPVDHADVTDADFAPDLAAEVVSGSDTFGDIDAKVRQYLDSGVRLVWLIDPLVRLVWLIDPLMRTVTAHAPAGHPRLFSDADDLVGDPVLSGLRIPVRGIFS